MFPLFASRLPSLCEILNDSNAVLVEPENPDSLVQGIEKYLPIKNKAQDLASHARMDVNAYTWEKRGEMISRFIQAELNK